MANLLTIRIFIITIKYLNIKTDVYGVTSYRYHYFYQYGQCEPILTDKHN